MKTRRYTRIARIVCECNTTRIIVKYCVSMSRFGILVRCSVFIFFFFLKMEKYICTLIAEMVYRFHRFTAKDLMILCDGASKIYERRRRIMMTSTYLYLVNNVCLTRCSAIAAQYINMQLHLSVLQTSAPPTVSQVSIKSVYT